MTEQIRCSGCGQIREWNRFECLTACACMGEEPEINEDSDSCQVDTLVREKIAEIKLQKSSDGYWIIFGSKDEIVIHIDKLLPENSGLITHKIRDWVKSNFT